jgi:predicted RNA-binding Zn-ribbon protein involved in translation (DUF1610 family)
MTDYRDTCPDCGGIVRGTDGLSRHREWLCPERDGASAAVEDTDGCPMCGQQYESYLQHLTQCPTRE